MKIRQLRNIPVFILILSIVLVASACGQTQNTPSGTTQAVSSAPAGTTAPEPALDPMAKYDPVITVRSASVMLSDSDKLPEGQTWDNNVWTKAYSEELGMNVKYDFSVTAWDQVDPKLNMVIASGDLPDIFPVNLPQYNQLCEAGQIEDLTDIYQKYATPLLKEHMDLDGGNTFEGIKYKGRLYGIPHGSDVTGSAPMMFIRDDWRTKLGLPEPKTMQDVLALAEAFATKDPDGNSKNDTYGIAMAKDLIYDGAWNLMGFFAAYHAYPYIGSQEAFWLKGSDDKLVPALIQPEIKPALQALQDLFKKGAIDPEFAVKADIGEDVNKGIHGIMFGAVWTPAVLSLLKDNVPEMEFKSYEIPSIDGKPYLAPIGKMALSRIFVVRKGFEHPEAIIKAANLQMEKWFGPNKDLVKYVDGPNGEAIWRSQMVMAQTVHNSYATYENVSGALQNKIDVSTLDASQKGYFDKAKAYLDGTKTGDNWVWLNYFGPTSAYSIIDKYKQNDSFLYNSFFGVPTATLSEKGATIYEKHKEMLTKVIMGADVNAEFDKFVQYWNEQGGQNITKEVNDWFVNTQK